MSIRVSVKKIIRVIIGVMLVLGLSGTEFPASARAQEQNTARLRQFDFVSAEAGWILLDQQIFWTLDAGRTWTEVTPDLLPQGSIQAVDFMNANVGWVLWMMWASDGGSLFYLSTTSDQGISWATSPLSLFEAGEPAGFAEKAQMDWLDLQNGWIAVKQFSGSNFSLGTLFTTSDGGASWTRSALPVADQVYFAEAGFGWAGGGPSGAQLFETHTGGSVWKDVAPGHPQAGVITMYPPFYAAGSGLLVTTQLAEENFLNVFEYQSGLWALLDQTTLAVQPGAIALSILDARNFVAVIPGTRSIVRLENGRLYSLENTDGLSAAIVDLDMLTLEVGWAKATVSDCANASALDEKSAALPCTSSTLLLNTSNGGVTWRTVSLPFVEAGVAQAMPINNGRATAMTTLTGLGNSQVFIGQGFDKCELPTASQLQTWWDNSPYKTVNLYIGGSNRACDNLPLSAVYLKTIHQQGWKFIPTWVGPQAPCTGYLYRMSSDVNTAYSQGVAEADLAVDRLAELGLTYPDKTGSVIYYDIEHYGTNAACRSAVNAFMNGWVSQVRARGNLAGVYGSTLCNTGLSDFLNITNVPDVIWPARWYHNQGAGYYDPNATVWDLGTCLPNTAWANHQRIRQYEGDHFETWGDLTLGIDSNVLDGVVAVPYGLHFEDTPSDHPYVLYIETLYHNGYTAGCSAIPFLFCPDAIMDRAQAAVFMLRGNFGGGYSPSEPAHFFMDNWANVLWAEGWAEAMFNEGLSAGCNPSPLQFCPHDQLTNAQAAVFALRLKYGTDYTPPPATGTVFADLTDTVFWATAWAEQAYAEGLLPACGTSGGKPLFCPNSLVSRGFGAYIIVQAKNLSMP